MPMGSVCHYLQKAPCYWSQHQKSRLWYYCVSWDYTIMCQKLHFQMSKLILIICFKCADHLLASKEKVMANGD